jgi:TRAP-type C4-dicarboxylate transport system substrate-binding protein
MYDIAYHLQPLSINKRLLGRLSPDHQKAIKEAAREACVWQREIAAKMDADDLETMQKNYGVIIIQPDIDAWRKALEPVQEKFPQCRDIINKIKAIK